LSTGQEDKQVVSPSKGRRIFLYKYNTLPHIQREKKTHSFQQHTKDLNSHSIDVNNKHLKQMSSTLEELKKLFLIEIKPIRYSFKIKFIQIHYNQVKSTNFIEIQVSGFSFKFKLEIELEILLFVHLVTNV